MKLEILRHSNEEKSKGFNRIEEWRRNIRKIFPWEKERMQERVLPLEQIEEKVQSKPIIENTVPLQVITESPIPIKIEEIKKELSLQEKAWVANTQTKVENKHIKKIFGWIKHPETRGHLSPRPKTKGELKRYYANFGEEPDWFGAKITPLVALNSEGEPLGVLTIRWRGDRYIPKNKGIASIERLVVDPKLKGRGIATRLLAEAHKVIFEKENDKRNPRNTIDYESVRVWVMTDKEAGDIVANINLFHQKFGYDAIKGSWKEYCRMRNRVRRPNEPELKTGGRNALWFDLTREEWERDRLKWEKWLKEYENNGENIKAKKL